MTSEAYRSIDPRYAALADDDLRELVAQYRRDTNDDRTPARERLVMMDEIHEVNFELIIRGEAAKHELPIWYGWPVGDALNLDSASDQEVSERVALLAERLRVYREFVEEMRTTRDDAAATQQCIEASQASSAIHNELMRMKFAGRLAE